MEEYCMEETLLYLFTLFIGPTVELKINVQTHITQMHTISTYERKVNKFRNYQIFGTINPQKNINK